MLRNLILAFLITVPFVGPTSASLNENPVSDVMYGPAPGYQDAPSIASDGENFLVVWQDQRAWPPVIYAARVNREGELLDPTGIRIPTGGYPRAVVFAGEAYVILWSVGHDLYGARISRAGQLIDGPRVFASNVPVDWFGAASNGARIVIAWADRFDVLSAEGEPLQRDILLPVPAIAPYVASNGSGFLLAWWSSFGMAGAPLQAWLLDSRGQPTGSINMISTNTAGFDLAVASDGRDYLLLYSNVNTHTVESRSISGDGIKVSPAFVVPMVPFGAANVPLAWGTSNYVAFSPAAVSAQSGWPQAVRRLRLDREGKPLDDGMSTVAEGFEIGNLAAASNGNDVLVAWHGRRLYEDFYDVYAAKGSGVPDSNASGTLLSRSAVPQASPSIAFSGRNYLVVRQERSGVFFNRILLNGEHLDGTGIFVSSLSPYPDAAPRVIFDGENYVLAWMAAGSINGVGPVLRLARVQPDSGTVLDLLGTAVDETAGISSFDIASDGQATMVVWSDGRVHAARFNRYLQMLDVSRHDLSPKEMSAGNPAVAWNGSEWLIAFDEQFFYYGGGVVPPPLIRANLHAIRLSPLFTLLDPEPIAVAVNDSESNLRSHVASDGNEFAIIWTGGALGASQIRARHMRDGAFVDATAVLANGNAWSVVWDGSRYAVGYEAKSADGSSDALLTHIGRTGEPLPNDRMIISATPDNETMPRLVAAGIGDVTATYVRVASEPLYGGVGRVFLRQPTITRTRSVRPRSLPIGHWAGGGDCADVTLTQASVVHACSIGVFPTPVLQGGRFEVDGTISITVGPARSDGAPAHFSGTVQGNTLSLIIRTTTSTVGPLTLQFGSTEACPQPCV